MEADDVVVHLASLGRSYRVLEEQCANPECECTEVTFRLTALPDADHPNPNAATLTAYIDGDTWQEISGPGRPAAGAKWAQELLQVYPAADRAVIQTATRKKRIAARRLREYRLPADEVEKGALIAYSEVVSERGSITTGGGSFSFRLHHDGTDYLVEDTYCANPECDCREVILRFFEYKIAAEDKDKAVLEERFAAKLLLDGKLTIDERFDISEDRAAAVMQAWSAEFGDDLEEFQWRYAKIKEIGRLSAKPRAMATAQKRQPDQATDDARIGRNDPCPCGSGKKYKRCCGR